MRQFFFQYHRFLFKFRSRRDDDNQSASKFCVHELQSFHTMYLSMRRSEDVIHNFSSTQKNIFDSLSSSYRLRRVDAIFAHIFKICTIDLLD